MSSTSKQQRKQKKRQQKNIEQRKRTEAIKRQRARQSQYPVVRIDDTYGDPRFIEAVKLAATRTDFDNPELFGDADRAFHKILRADGLGEAARVVRAVSLRLALDQHPAANVLAHTLAMSYGEALFQQIPEDVRKRFLPYNDMRVDFTARDIVLRFSSMNRKSGDGGTIFYSSRRPKISLRDQEWKVAFSRHAIERICARLNPRYLTYAAAGDVHAVLNTCIWYEPVTLFPNHPAFAIWDTCSNPTNLSYQLFVREVLGERNVVPGNGPCYHRVGYCPVVFEDGFAKAKTFLCPGYDTTPEYGLVRKSRMSALDKDLMIHSASSSDLLHIADEGVEAIKWFHENGVLQVKQMRHKVFDE